jgi:hypothetical protein
VTSHGNHNEFPGKREERFTQDRRRLLVRRPCKLPRALRCNSSTTNSCEGSRIDRRTAQKVRGPDERSPTSARMKAWAAFRVRIRGTDRCDDQKSGLCVSSAGTRRTVQTGVVLAVAPPDDERAEPSLTPSPPRCGPLRFPGGAGRCAASSRARLFCRRAAALAPIYNDVDANFSCLADQTRNTPSERYFDGE